MSVPVVRFTVAGDEASESVTPAVGETARRYTVIYDGHCKICGRLVKLLTRWVIQHLVKPETQVVTAAEVGFFPVANVALPANLSPGVKLLAGAVGATSGAKDALPALLPAGLADKAGEFNKVYLDTFQRIILKNEPVKDVLASQAKVLADLMTALKAPCWAPDKASDGACPVN